MLKIKRPEELLLKEVPLLDNTQFLKEFQAWFNRSIYNHKINKFVVIEEFNPNTEVYSGIFKYQKELEIELATFGWGITCSMERGSGYKLIQIFALHPTKPERSPLRYMKEDEANPRVNK